VCDIRHRAGRPVRGCGLIRDNADNHRANPDGPTTGYNIPLILNIEEAVGSVCHQHSYVAMGISNKEGR
jgi:hypothetical protein